MPSQTQCIQSMGRLSGIMTSFPKTVFPLIPNIIFPDFSANLLYLRLSLAVLWDTFFEVVYSQILDLNSLSQVPGCLQLVHPNKPLYCFTLKSIAFAGRSGTTDCIRQMDGIFWPVLFSNSQPVFEILSSSTKLLRYNYTMGFSFPYQRPVSIIFVNLYLSFGGSSTRKHTKGQILYFLDFIIGAPSLLTTREKIFLFLARGS